MEDTGHEDDPHPADARDHHRDQEPLPGADETPPGGYPCAGRHALADRRAERAADFAGAGPGRGAHGARPRIGQAVAHRVGEHGDGAVDLGLLCFGAGSHCRPGVAADPPQADWITAREPADGAAERPAEVPGRVDPTDVFQRIGDAGQAGRPGEGVSQVESRPGRDVVGCGLDLGHGLLLGEWGLVPGRPGGHGLRWHRVVRGRRQAVGERQERRRRSVRVPGASGRGRRPSQRRHPGGPRGRARRLGAGRPWSSLGHDGRRRRGHSRIRVAVQAGPTRAAGDRGWIRGVDSELGDDAVDVGRDPVGRRLPGGHRLGQDAAQVAQARTGRGGHQQDARLTVAF